MNCVSDHLLSEECTNAFVDFHQVGEPVASVPGVVPEGALTGPDGVVVGNVAVAQPA